MKKLFLILILTLSISTQAKFLENIRLTLAQSTSKNLNSFDYDFLIALDYISYLQTEIEAKRVNDVHLYNHSIKLLQDKEFWQAHASWESIDIYNLDVKQIDLRGAYKNWSCGVAQSWINNKPETKIIIGKKVDYNYKILRFSYNQDFLTSNFKKWEYNTSLSAGIELYIFEFGLKFNLTKIDNLDWDERIYIKFMF